MNFGRMYEYEFHGWPNFLGLLRGGVAWGGAGLREILWVCARGYRTRRVPNISHLYEAMEGLLELRDLLSCIAYFRWGCEHHFGDIFVTPSTIVFIDVSGDKACSQARRCM
jgi:hypothetical protein